MPRYADVRAACSACVAATAVSEYKALLHVGAPSVVARHTPSPDQSRGQLVLTQLGGFGAGHEVGVDQDLVPEVLGQVRLLPAPPRHRLGVHQADLGLGALVPVDVRAVAGFLGAQVKQCWD